MKRLALWLIVLAGLAWLAYWTPGEHAAPNYHEDGR